MCSYEIFSNWIQKNYSCNTIPQEIKRNMLSFTKQHLLRITSHAIIFSRRGDKGLFHQQLAICLSRWYQYAHVPSAFSRHVIVMVLVTNNNSQGQQTIGMSRTHLLFTECSMCVLKGACPNTYLLQDENTTTLTLHVEQD